MIKRIKQSLNRISILPYVTYFCGLSIPFLHNDVSLSNYLMILAACPILLLFLVQFILNLIKVHNDSVLEKVSDYGAIIKSCNQINMPQEAIDAEKNLKEYPKE